MQYSLFAIFLFLLSGCAKPTSSNPLDGRHYYLLESGYNCRTQSGATIQSYKDSIYFYAGMSCRTGDACNDTVNCSRQDSYDISADSQSLNAFGKTYFYKENPPLLE
jgi:hypothetical protein